MRDHKKITRPRERRQQVFHVDGRRGKGERLHRMMCGLAPRVAHRRAALLFGSAGTAARC
jgi:hypothetical protein